MNEFVTGTTISAMARQLYGYEISPAAAEMVANSAGALLTSARMLDVLNLGGIEPPFSYPGLIAEARRIMRR